MLAKDGCDTHRETCKFGRDHMWFAGFYENGVFDPDRMKCGVCDQVCDAELREGGPGWNK